MLYCCLMLPTGPVFNNIDFYMLHSAPQTVGRQQQDCVQWFKHHMYWDIMLINKLWIFWSADSSFG